ncbi:MAG: sigma-70 family RNA polymerase sigma factor [Christensenellaceae bacterium]|jgi:RNA polymerase sporulation-specific sigma factor|nr:sigma-70 family RNA polymerase sigma factor [Christensenellaceae bacterium]
MIFENFITFLTKVFFFSGFVNEKGGFPKPLSKKEELEHFQRFWTGDKTSKDILIRHNLRLVAHIVKKYNGAAEADDLISCGTIGLIKAINSYRADKNTMISTYAATCINNEILMYLRVNKKHLAISSLDTPAEIGDGGESGDLSLLEILPSEMEQGGVDVEISKNMLDRLITEMKSRLDAREFEIINLRYGLANHIAMPQREVANKLKISRSYISRIEKHAIEVVKQIVKEKEFLGFT